MCVCEREREREREEEREYVCVYRERQRWLIKEIKNGLVQLVYLAGKAFTMKVVATDVTANGVGG